MHLCRLLDSPCEVHLLDSNLAGSAYSGNIPEKMTDANGTLPSSAPGAGQLPGQPRWFKRALQGICCAFLCKILALQAVPEPSQLGTAVPRHLLSVCLFEKMKSSGVFTVLHLPFATCY